MTALDPIPTVGSILDTLGPTNRAPAKPVDRGAARSISHPQPGYWLMRLVKAGPLVPAAIIKFETRYEPDSLAAFICGDQVPLDDVWLRRGEPITKEEYEFRVADQAWAKQWAPEEAQAKPDQPINLMTTPLPF